MSFFIPYRNHFVRFITILLVMMMGGLSPIYGSCDREKEYGNDTCCPEEEVRIERDRDCREECAIKHRAENLCDVSGYSFRPLGESDDADRESPDRAGDRCPPGCWCCGTVLSLSSIGDGSLLTDHPLPLPLLPDRSLPIVPPVAPDRPPRPSVS